MNRIRQIIEEIKELENDPTQRASLRIHSLLENNKTLFLEHLDADDFKHLLAGFESLVNTSPAEYNTAAYKDAFRKHHSALAFYLNRVI